jgi:hypothetical protein
MTCAIAHHENDRAVLDAAIEIKAPFSPPEAVRDIVQMLRRYHLTSVTGDAYAAQWVSESFRQHGIAYRHAEQNRSELFLSLLPLLTSTNAVLLDIPRLVSQISNLERRTGRTGRDAVDHPRGAGSHDDLAVAAAGALVAAASMAAKEAAREARMARTPNRPERANVGFAKQKGILGQNTDPRRSGENWTIVH